MFIVMLSPECAPAAKAGGLGDVVHGLSRELAMRGNHVEIILPKYDCMRYDRISDLQKTYENLWVPFHGRWIPCDVYFGFVDGLKCFFIEPHSEHHFFERGALYGQQDDPERFAFFSHAALEFMLKSNKHPDIIHCHDWQTALVPVLLYEVYAGLGMNHSRVCYTLHNVGHQGITGPQVLRQVGLDANALMNPTRLLDPSRPGAVNLMKGGIVFANFITTVSPTYANEIRYSSLGEGLQDTLRTHEKKVGGVLNGIDYSMWNPEIDRYIPHHYNAATLQDKIKNKAVLRRRLLLRDNFRPIIAVVSRLDRQKGVHLIEHAIFRALAQNCQFVLLGTPSEDAIAKQFWDLKHRLNDNPDCHLELSYDEELSHLVYAGADMLLIPSIYEPCGLTQMIAMKYGTVPIVRATGGLADTVFDANHSDKDFSQRTGYVFQNADGPGLDSAMQRAIGLWYQYPEYFRQLRMNGMAQDYSWHHPAEHYLNIYNYIKV
jgi:starch synthase